MIRITRPGNLNNINSKKHHCHYRHHYSKSPLPLTPPFVPSKEYLEKIQAQIPYWLPNSPNATYFRAHTQRHLDSLKANTQTCMKNSKQHLENVGQYLQQTLAPFIVDSKNHIDEQKPSTTNEQQQTSNATYEERKQMPTTNTCSTPEANAIIKYPNLTQIISTTSNNNTEESSANGILPLMANESTNIRNPLEEAVHDCMEKMISMGYIDAHGALRELVRAKHGDINLVLDAINPR